MNIKHRMTLTPEYKAWVAMKTRCLTSKAGQYRKYYQERGIAICTRWLDSFENFYKDMGPRPSSRHSLDRIDSNGSYSPENCRWATNEEQHSNTSSNKIVEYRGERLTIAQWSRRFGFRGTTLYKRLAAGFTFEEAITLPVCGKKRRWTQRERQQWMKEHLSEQAMVEPFLIDSSYY